jgi:16S rRNA (uracil1498-N3)-methyltransferase
MRAGDHIEAIDSAARTFDARIHVEGKTVHAELLAAYPQTDEPVVHVTIAQAVPKAQKMDFIVEKCTELGASAFVPFLSERTIADSVSENKLERWRRIAKTAAMQCARETVPTVAEPLAFKDLTAVFPEYDCVLFPWELAERVPVRERLEQLLTGAARVLVLIGPEGGFSHGEAALAQQAGGHIVWLGPRILRTETAGMTVLAFVNLLTGG